MAEHLRNSLRPTLQLQLRLPASEGTEVLSVFLSDADAVISLLHRALISRVQGLTGCNEEASGKS